MWSSHPQPETHSSPTHPSTPATTTTTSLPHTVQTSLKLWIPLSSHLLDSSWMSHGYKAQSEDIISL